MATHAEEERIRQEQGERFLTQLNDMFAQTRTDMAAQFMPRAETQARMDHLDEVVERIGSALEKLTGNVYNFHEGAPRIFADKAETKAEMAGLRTDIAKLETAFDAFKDRGFGWRFEDEQNRYKSALAGQQYERRERREQTNISLERWITIGIAIAMIAANVILALRH